MLEKLNLYDKILEHIGPDSFCPTEVDAKKCAGFLRRCIAHVYASGEAAKTREKGGAVVIRVARGDYLSEDARVSIDRLLPHVPHQINPEPGTFVVVFVLLRDEGRDGEISLALPRDPAAVMSVAFFREGTATPVETVGTGEAFAFRSVARNCYGNCRMNEDAFQRLAGKPLRVVAGSLGLCCPEPVYFEWGGLFDKPHVRAIEFLECPITGGPDVHFWLEDADGKVYDVVDRYLCRVVAPVHDRTISTEAFAHGCVISGLRKDQLKEAGLLYLPAEPLVQEILIKKHESYLYKHR